MGMYDTFYKSPMEQYQTKAFKYSSLREWYIGDILPDDFEVETYSLAMRHDPVYVNIFRLEVMSFTDEPVFETVYIHDVMSGTDYPGWLNLKQQGDVA